MAAKSNYLENAALAWAMTSDVVTRPTAWHVALFSTDPTDANSGTEISTAGYARQSDTFTVTGDNAVNDTELLFGPFTADPPSVSHFGIYDASTSGNLLYHGALAAPVDVATDDRIRIAAGALSITEA